MKRLRAMGCVISAAIAINLPIASYAADYSKSSGRELFGKFCASCHGVNAKGDGPIAKSLKTPPADLTSIARRYGGNFPTKRIEEVVDGRVKVDAHGPSAMPVWGEEFTRSEGGKAEAEKATAAVIRKIVDYLRSVQAGGSL